ncbi:MAG: hybrid sensor histidine kinase/response regulator [Planctomycetes bacterium]|nr:hybrid sensor histidine kinase/response regulator [Planctomycetota bacterium]
MDNHLNLEHELKQTHILIVDDEEDMRNLLTTYIKPVYSNFRSAASAAEALEEIKNHPPQLLISDLNMPEKGGAELSKELRAEGFEDLAIIILTSQGSYNDAHHLLQDSQISDFLSKPITKASLLFSIAKALKEQWLIQQHKQHEKHLSQEVDAKTAKLKKALQREESLRQELVKAEKISSLGQMVAGVAHDMATPIGNAFTLSSHLNNTVSKITSDLANNNLTKANLSQFLGSVTKSSQVMIDSLGKASELIRNFKKLAKKQQDEDNKTFNLLDLFNSTFDSFRMNETHIDLKIDCPTDLEINSCPTTINNCLRSLIQNSLLHGFEGHDKGSITLNVERDQESILIKYEDDGKGISQKNLKHLFDPFYTTKINQGGNGLGLSITYIQVSEILKGSIQCESTEGQGTSFRIILPQNRSLSQ